MSEVPLVYIAATGSVVSLWVADADESLGQASGIALVPEGEQLELPLWFDPATQTLSSSPPS